MAAQRRLGRGGARQQSAIPAWAPGSSHAHAAPPHPTPIPDPIPTQPTPIPFLPRSVELAFQRVPGVVQTAVGYSQGRTKNPTYQEARPLQRCLIMPAAHQVAFATMPAACSRSVLDRARRCRCSVLDRAHCLSQRRGPAV